MRFDASSVPPVVSRVDERMGGVAAEVRSVPFDAAQAARSAVEDLDLTVRALEAKREDIRKRLAAAAEKAGSPLDPDDPDKTAAALDAFLAKREEAAKGNAEAVGFGPEDNPLDDPEKVARLDPADPRELERLAKGRADLASLRESLKETLAALEAAKEQRGKAEAARDRAIAEFKDAFERDNERVGRNLDRYGGAGGRFLGPDGLSAVFDTVNESVGFRRMLGLPSPFDLSGELEPEHGRAFARIVDELTGESLHDPQTFALKTTRETEDGRTVALDDEYVRDRLRARGLLSQDGAIDAEAVRRHVAKWLEDGAGAPDSDAQR